jgi:hypothetical protein
MNLLLLAFMCYKDYAPHTQVEIDNNLEPVDPSLAVERRFFDGE